MAKKIAGVLPKNEAVQSAPSMYKEPARPKRLEVEEAEDGSYIISCYGGTGQDNYMGKKHTAKTAAEAMDKFETFFGKSSKKEKDSEEA